MHRGARTSRLHCLEPCWSTIIAGERLPYARRGPKQSAVGGQPEPSSAPSESRGRGVPTEACKRGEVEGLLGVGGIGGGIRSQPQLHSHPNRPLQVSYTLVQQAASVRKMPFFYLPLVRLLLCSSDASRRELSIAPIGLQFRLPQPRGLQF